MTLPTAPPRMQARAKLNSRWPLCALSIHRMNSAAQTPRAVKNQRCQPPAEARNEKAAPVLCTRTMLKKLVTTVLSPSW